ncbi:RnfABCDGE type electron transport complex subunit D [Desulfosporosinus sp. OT]|uniref:RnfABCDGE type electron transport complex subunit D n=1 Tax=Desulfosporosinus sp. OT TaxID=913865 RepID=UPI000223A812|nr:RnfABCDGE type electron transport complex subunit D [Desulfosporosinus sp. OT]EGW36260.1 putative membrane protein [Desulfosporosinus sp. OT]
MTFNTTVINNKVNPVDTSSGRIFLTPKTYVLIVLLIISAIAGTNSADLKGILNVGVAAITAILFDGIIFRFQSRKKLFSDGGVITGLIIALVLDSTTPWHIVAVTTVIALSSKHLFNVNKKPIFNPAAFGLLVAIFLFSSEQSWWGAFPELSVWTVAFLLIGGFLVTERVNKFPQVLVFLGGYFALLLIMGFFGISQAGDALRIPFINCALFLAFFMVTDPPTSPGKYKDQIWFGIITALASIIIYIIFGGLSYLLIGLLLANVWNVLRVYMAKVFFASRGLENKV